MNALNHTNDASRFCWILVQCGSIQITKSILNTKAFSKHTQDTSLVMDANIGLNTFTGAIQKVDMKLLAFLLNG